MNPNNHNPYQCVFIIISVISLEYNSKLCYLIINLITNHYRTFPSTKARHINTISTTEITRFIPLNDQVNTRVG